MEIGPECFLPRGRHRGTAELFISISSFGCFTAFLSIIFSLGDREGGRAGMSVIEVRCKRGDALLLAPNMPVLNGHLGDLCSWLFLKTVLWSRKSEGTFIGK